MMPLCVYLLLRMLGCADGKYFTSVVITSAISIYCFFFFSERKCVIEGHASSLRVQQLQQRKQFRATDCTSRWHTELLDQDMTVCFPLSFRLTVTRWRLFVTSLFPEVPPAVQPVTRAGKSRSKHKLVRYYLTVMFTECKDISFTLMSPDQRRWDGGGAVGGASSPKQSLDWKQTNGTYSTCIQKRMICWMRVRTHLHRHLSLFFPPSVAYLTQKITPLWDNLTQKITPGWR